MFGETASKTAKNSKERREPPGSRRDRGCIAKGTGIRKIQNLTEVQLIEEKDPELGDARGHSQREVWCSKGVPAVLNGILTASILDRGTSREPHTEGILPLEGYRVYETEKI